MTTTEKMSLFEQNLEVLKNVVWDDEGRYSTNLNRKIDQNWQLCQLYIEELRIKPEPKYRPFKDAKEFEPYRDRWIMPINRKHSYCKVTDYSNDTLYVDMQETDFESAYDSYTFDDGTPFGILQEVE
jgi:hypothetical protein